MNLNNDNSKFFIEINKMASEMILFCFCFLYDQFILQQKNEKISKYLKESFTNIFIVAIVYLEHIYFTSGLYISDQKNVVNSSWKSYSVYILFNELITINGTPMVDENIVKTIKVINQF